ncbi:hypothetical protein HDK77DRAFT_188132 [Phyllosticta capitalensis]
MAALAMCSSTMAFSSLYWGLFSPKVALALRRSAYSCDKVEIVSVGHDGEGDRPVTLACRRGRTQAVWLRCGWIAAFGNPPGHRLETHLACTCFGASAVARSRLLPEAIPLWASCCLRDGSVAPSSNASPMNQTWYLLLPFALTIF